MAPRAVSDLEERLLDLAAGGLERSPQVLDSGEPTGPIVSVHGRRVLLLCSNDYLGLAGHPRVREAAAEAALRLGTGAGASRLVCGTTSAHRALEARLAGLEGSEACLLLGSGYLANIAVLTALTGEGDLICSDALNHASIVDGCRLARAQRFVYRHRDVEHLRWGLQRARAEGARRCLIVTDSVFSMDGDVAPLAALARCAREHGARLVVDEAHATGVLGPGGAGAVAAAGLQDEVDVIVGTLSKALGSYGAYVCASETIVRHLVNVARPFIFSTAPPPSALAAAGAALDVLEAEPQRMDRARANAATLRAALGENGIAVPTGQTAIVPLLLGDPHLTMDACAAALQDGVFAQGIRPPTVPAGTSRLRLTAMATHTEAQLRDAATVLARAVSREPVVA